MLGNKLINTNAGGGCTNTVDLYNPFPDGGGVALYQLNGDATDVSGNYDGTASNVTYGAGEFGQAGVFNGSNSEINLNSAVLPSSVFSVSMWFNLNTINRTNYLITQYILAGGSNGRFEFAVDSTNNFVIYLEGGALTFTTSVSLSANTWYNVVLIKNGASGWACYLDGQSLGTNSDTRNIYTGDNTRLGKRVGLSSGVLDGSLDQVRIFNRALRPYEVEALYTEEYCTPTIVPSEHFNTVLYTAATTNGTYDITGSSFQPDLIWVKNRDNVEQHYLMDSVRGLTNMTDKFLQSSTTNSESSASAMVNGTTVTAIQGGFRVVETSINAGELYFNGRTYVSWNFKAGGAAVTNPQGNTASQISANPDAGFSIVTHTSSMLSSQTFGHGLNSTPKIVISRVRNIADSWWVFMPDVIGSTNVLELNATAAARSVGLTFNANNTTFNIQWTSSSYDFLHYCFAEVEGFSSFGSYVGTGASGKTVVTGFEPAFIMVKSSSLARNWHIFDNKRTSGQQHYYLDPNVSNVEVTSFDAIRFLENGFEFVQGDDQFNGSGASYIYMAFAADPTTVEPSLEDSFNTVLYEGNETANKSVTGVGFQPDFVWIKNRDNSRDNALFDSVRGQYKFLSSNSTGSEYTFTDTFVSFDSDGFTVNESSAVNWTSMVAWNWKGAELPAINSNGSITSVVSANPAAGFSIVSWTGNGVSGSTVGHGLTEVPEMIIVKNRTSGSAQWAVYHSAYGATKHTLLNTTDAASTTGDWNNTEPTNSVITFNNGSRTNASGNNYIAYVFHSIVGFSKFGFWQGGTTSINLGFEPAFVLNQDYGAGGSWGIFDSVRGFDKALVANSSNAEVSSTFITPNATGFTVPSESSIVFRLYMAFANQF